MTVKVYERILDLFEAEGIRAIFGIPDPNFVHLFHLADERGWDVVTPHHEAAAGFMAEAASRMSGKPAVAIGTLGPGMANMMPAVQCAKVENSPVIFLGGQRARITEQRVRRGRIQFVQQMPMIEDSVKWSASIEYAQQTDEIIRQGLRVALSGTPGPVYIEYPQHVIQEELDVPPVLAPERYRLVGQSAGAEQVTAAVAAIRAAKQPIILAGHGVHTTRSGASVRELAELMACPVIQTSGGTSYIEGIEERTFPYGFSKAAVDAVVKSDLVVALGTELGEPVHFGRGRHWIENEANRTWIYAEQNPEIIGINRPIDVPLIGDLRSVVPQLVGELKSTPRTATPELAQWIKDDADRLATLAVEAPTGQSPVHPARMIVEATKDLPADAIQVRDGGATTIFLWTYAQSKPLDVMWNQNFGHLGTGLPYAIGASVVDGGKRPVLFVTGDSSFLFHIAELETAARLKLPLVCVVGVDFSWGLEVGVYKRTFGQGSRETGTHWSTDVRLDKVAEGFGCYGEFVENDADIAPAITRAFESGKPGVIHVNVDPKANSEEMPSYDEFRTWYAEGQQ